MTLYSHRSGPNPWKVAIVLDELSLPYTTVSIEMDGSQQASPYIDLCPNSRMPALIDHSNNDYTIWGSGAIILYIVSKYDTEHKISFSKAMDNELTGQGLQWLMFQISGMSHCPLSPTPSPTPSPPPFSFSVFVLLGNCVERGISYRVTAYDWYAHDRSLGSKQFRD